MHITPYQHRALALFRKYVIRHCSGEASAMDMLKLERLQILRRSILNLTSNSYITRVEYRDRQNLKFIKAVHHYAENPKHLNDPRQRDLHRKRAKAAVTGHRL